ncbi:uncharacterized protein LOC101863032 isoform X2 [Aplysia californica]|uniref:Uncharacterized protein LOC101863032 isoform X2 n=1 Tax=Aplysia californica TaxID=6500 RepID=A0ABM1VVH4_APLCA|nr:uncharacterized protein LOC101863032 isoform X2 [Aplysia californica]
MFDASDKTVVWGWSPIGLFIGLVFHVISIACPGWMENTDVRVGLWRLHCEQEGCQGGAEDLFSSCRWYTAAQVLESCATLCVALCAAAGLLRVNLGQPRYQSACALCALLAGILSLIGCAVFGFGQPRPPSLNLSYAFVFNVVSGSLCVLCSPVLYLDLRCKHR